MKENIAIFLIVLILFIVIAVVGYLIFVLQDRMGIARRGGDTESEVSSVPP
jgi:flagellar basal body-associated protein FliL